MVSKSFLITVLYYWIFVVSYQSENLIFPQESEASAVLGLRWGSLFFYTKNQGCKLDPKVKKNPNILKIYISGYNNNRSMKGTQSALSRGLIIQWQTQALRKPWVIYVQIKSISFNQIRFEIESLSNWAIWFFSVGFQSAFICTQNKISSPE